MKDKILLVEFKAKFEQYPDDCSSNNDQILEVTMCDAGAGHYFVIETERWSFDKSEDLTNLIGKVQEAFKIFE